MKTLHMEARRPGQGARRACGCNMPSHALPSSAQRIVFARPHVQAPSNAVAVSRPRNDSICLGSECETIACEKPRPKTAKDRRPARWRGTEEGGMGGGC
eukprot:1635700-Rhodomonas_salina.4